MRRLLGAPLAFATRFGGRGLALVFAIVLARELGPEQYGIYAYATAWSAVLIIPAALGLPQILLRQVALYRGRERPDLIRGIVRRAHQIVFPLSLALTLGAAAVAVVAVDPIFLLAVLIVLPSVVLRPVGQLWSGVLQGLGRSELSFVPVFVVFPVTMLLAVGLLVLLDIKVTALNAAAIYTGAGVVTLLFAYVLAQIFYRPVVAGSPVTVSGVGLRSLLGPFTAVALIAALSTQVGMLMLGAFGEPASVGIFQVGTKLAEPASILLMAITITVAPQITKSFDAGDFAQLRRITSRAARICFWLSVPVAAVLIICREWLLGIFGSGFTSGGTVLILIVLAQLFNAFTGPVNITLMMTAHSRAVMSVSGAAVLLNIALCLILIPPLGATGAAIAMMADIFISQSILAVFAWRKLGVNTTAIPLRTIRGPDHLDPPG